MVNGHIYFGTDKRRVATAKQLFPLRFLGATILLTFLGSSVLLWLVQEAI